jgi:GntR family transcriptional regulator
MQNRELLREKKMKMVEEKLAAAVAEARALGVEYKALQEMLHLLYGEEE